MAGLRFLSFPPLPEHDFAQAAAVSHRALTVGAMTLELRRLTHQIEQLSRAMVADRADVATRANRAAVEWTGRDHEALAERVVAAKTSWLVALPTEPPRAVPLPPDSPPAWRVVATDGSQIELSRHEIAPCYLVNVGEAVLDYGQAPAARLASEPTLFFGRDDLRPLYGGEERAADGAVVSAARDAAEFGRLADLVLEADRPAVALVDGTLILWRDETNPRGLARLEPDDLRRKRLDAMLRLFEAGERAGIPVAGYISSPGGSDVVNALKVAVCPETRVDCDHCPYTPPGVRRGAFHDKPCDVVDRVTDAVLFRRVLGEGERGPLAWSSAPVIEAYGRHRIAFFYLDVGTELARIEVPAYVASSSTLLEFVHWAAYDQARRGLGYPVALAEAHEQAVVRGADRDAFFALVSRRFVRDGHPVRVSGKQLRKRGALA